MIRHGLSLPLAVNSLQLSVPLMAIRICCPLRDPNRRHSIETKSRPWRRCPSRLTGTNSKPGIADSSWSTIDETLANWFRQLKYTGEIRCLPCNAANVAIAPALGRAITLVSVPTGVAPSRSHSVSAIPRRDKPDDNGTAPLRAPVAPGDQSGLRGRADSLPGDRRIVSLVVEGVRAHLPSVQGGAAGSRGMGGRIGARAFPKASRTARTAPETAPLS